MNSLEFFVKSRGFVVSTANEIRTFTKREMVESGVKLSENFNVFASGFPSDAYEDEIYRVFTRAGYVLEIKLFFTSSGKSRGCCVVTFATEDAVRLAVGMNGFQYEGVYIHVTKEVPTLLLQDIAARDVVVNSPRRRVTNSRYRPHYYREAALLGLQAEPLRNGDNLHNGASLRSRHAASELVELNGSTNRAYVDSASLQSRHAQLVQLNSSKNRAYVDSASLQSRYAQLVELNGSNNGRPNYGASVQSRHAASELAQRNVTIAQSNVTIAQSNVTFAQSNGHAAGTAAPATTAQNKLAKPWKKLSQADLYQLSPSDSGVVINGGSENSPIKQRANPTYSSHNGISSSSAGTGQYNPQNGLTGNISLKTTANGPGTSGITDQSQSLFSHEFMRVPKRSLSDPVWQYHPVRDSQNNQVVSQTFQEYDMWNWNGFNLAKMIEEGLCKEDNNEPAKTSSTPTNPGINCKVGLPGCDCKLSKN